MSEPGTPGSIRGVIPLRASEVGRGRGWITADGRDVDIEVEVLLCGHETDCYL